MGQGWPGCILSHYCVWACFCSCLCLFMGKIILEISYCPGVSARCPNPKKRCRFILKCTKLRLETCSQKCFCFWNFEMRVVNWFGLAIVWSGWGPFATALLERGLLLALFYMDIYGPWVPLFLFQNLECLWYVSSLCAAGPRTRSPRKGWCAASVQHLPWFGGKKWANPQMWHAQLFLCIYVDPLRKTICSSGEIVFTERTIVLIVLGLWGYIYTVYIYIDWRKAPGFDGDWCFFS